MSDINTPELNQPSSPTYSTEPPTNTMAVISMIAGILGLTVVPVLGSIVALVVGYMARKEIRESNGSQGGDGIAVAGIVMGWISVGLAVLTCIAAIAFIAFIFAVTGVVSTTGSLLTFLLI